MAEWFPQKEGFLLNAKAGVLSDDTKPDIVIVEFRRVQGGNLSQRQILILECKRVFDDTTTGWQNAEVQLGHYLDEMPTPPRRRESMARWLLAVKFASTIINSGPYNRTVGELRELWAFSIRKLVASMI